VRPGSDDVELADAVVGYYVHHQGAGHRHRAASVAARLVARGLAVTGLSSGPRPAGWPGAWVTLARDDDPPAGTADDATAGGRLHWAPLRHPGLRSRAAALSAWIERERPAALVSDVSQEVALLARLHGVPVVSVVLPGDRTDTPHTLGLGVSTALVGCWPSSVTSGMTPGLDACDRDRLHAVGGLSRFAPVAPVAPVVEPGGALATTESRPPPVVEPGEPLGESESRPGDGGTRSTTGGRVVVLGGTGDAAADPHHDAALTAAQEQTPGWTWTVLGVSTWTDDPWSVLKAADVVVTHAGQNAVAEVAAARVPAVVVPRPRPHDEQVTTAAVLAADAWPVTVLGRLPLDGWADLLARTAALDGTAWAEWVDGAAADRFADVVASVARPAPIALDVLHSDTPYERAKRPGLSGTGPEAPR